MTPAAESSNQSGAGVESDTGVSQQSDANTDLDLTDDVIVDVVSEEEEDELRTLDTGYKRTATISIVVFYMGIKMVGGVKTSTDKNCLRKREFDPFLLISKMGFD